MARLMNGAAQSRAFCTMGHLNPLLSLTLLCYIMSNNLCSENDTLVHKADLMIDDPPPPSIIIKL